MSIEFAKYHEIGNYFILTVNRSLSEPVVTPEAVKLCDRTATVEFPGDPLKIAWSDIDQKLYMTEPAERVFTGTI